MANATADAYTETKEVLYVASVFLSPSTQEYNLYYGGDGNEELYMNLVADYMEPYLTASGISFGRNDPEQRVGAAIAKSNAGNYNLHLALHSNAAGEANAGTQRGIDVYYFRDSAAGKSAADIIVSNLAAIYPLPDRVRAVPNTTFAELRQTRAPAVLAEIGYHDNEEDAEWIRANLQQIARALALSVAEYLNVPFISPDEIEMLGEGLVVTGGGRLNIRNAPNLSADVVAQAPNGSTVTLISKEGDWYLIRRNNVQGYVYGQYIKVL